MNKLLPKNYLDWLSSIDIEDSLLYGDRGWYLMDETELSENITIDGIISPAYAQLISLVITQFEVTGQDNIISNTGELFTIERIRKCVAIGESNGAPLFVDVSKDNSLWCYYSDGGEIEKVSDSLDYFIEKAIVE